LECDLPRHKAVLKKAAGYPVAFFIRIPDRIAVVQEDDVLEKALAISAA